MGAASQPNKTAASIPAITIINFERLFFIERSLNFKAIIGRVEVMR